jgi:Spy/CpxP family protein refolding chaperone
MQKKTYGDKQRDAQQLKKQEELRARATAQSSPAPDTSKAGAEVNTVEPEKKRKADKRVRRPA